MPSSDKRSKFNGVLSWGGCPSPLPCCTWTVMGWHCCFCAHLTNQRKSTGLKGRKSKGLKGIHTLQLGLRWLQAVGLSSSLKQLLASKEIAFLDAVHTVVEEKFERLGYSSSNAAWFRRSCSWASSSFILSTVSKSAVRVAQANLRCCKDYYVAAAHHTDSGIFNGDANIMKLLVFTARLGFFFSGA